MVQYKIFSLGQASYFWSHLNCHPLFHKTLARVLERGALGHRQIVSAINYNAPNQLFSTQWFALPSNIPAPGSLDFVIFVAIILTFTFITNLIFEKKFAMPSRMCCCYKWGFKGRLEIFDKSSVLAD